MHQTIHKMPLSWFHTGDADLLLNWEARCCKAESLIHLFSCLFKLPPSQTSHGSNNGTTYWGSDGSMIPATASSLENKTIIAAISGPVSVAALVTGRNSSILHGELIGLVMDHILSQSQEGLQNSFQIISTWCASPRIWSRPEVLKLDYSGSLHNPTIAGS